MKLLFVVDSLTGQGRRFAEKMGFPVEDIQEAKPQPDQYVFLVTRSYNFGQIPETTQLFLTSHHQQVIGLAVGGNRTWGHNFGAAGDKIHQQYGIPLVQKFEGTGFPNEVKHVQEWVKSFIENQS